jgi:hypothetical protein
MKCTFFDSIRFAFQERPLGNYSAIRTNRSRNLLLHGSYYKRVVWAVILAYTACSNRFISLNCVNVVIVHIIWEDLQRTAESMQSLKFILLFAACSVILSGKCVPDLIKLYHNCPTTIAFPCVHSFTFDLLRRTWFAVISRRCHKYS